jgi:hypothetical protein
LKLVCSVNIVYKNLNPENSQDYAKKSQQNCVFMNLASGLYQKPNEVHIPAIASLPTFASVPAHGGI